MTTAIILVVAFCGSLLTFFSGFGLGTLLLPVMMIFYPPRVAIALTAIVHLANNLFKINLVKKSIHWQTVISFGIPSIFGALIGALLLGFLPNIPVFDGFHLFGKHCQPNLLKIIIGVLLLVFTYSEINPKLFSFIAQRGMSLGGFISGFFGGLSGHQGALRSAYLIKQPFDKTTFIATGVAIACLVDLCRLPIYFGNLAAKHLFDHSSVLLLTCLAAIAGAFLGNKLLTKVTLKTVQRIVVVFIALISIALIIGFV